MGVESTVVRMGRFDPFTLLLARSPWDGFRYSLVRSKSRSLMLLTLTCRYGHVVFEVYESTPIRSDYKGAKGQTPCSRAQPTFFFLFLLLAFSAPCLICPDNSVKMVYWLFPRLFRIIQDP